MYSRNPTRTSSFPRHVVLQEGALPTSKPQLSGRNLVCVGHEVAIWGLARRLDILGGGCTASSFSSTPRFHHLISPHQMGPQSAWKILTAAYCIHVCRASNMYIHWPAPLPFRKLETDVSAKLITGLLYLCLEFKELPSSGFK